MINPGAIPQIPGNVDALSAHANGLRTAGTGFADTGADVHATWQSLAPAYLAPESEQLLQATRPVTEVSGNVGRDVEAVAGALQRYADEVRPLQQHLRDLKAQAEQLVADIHAYENQKPSTSEMAASAKTGIVPDKDWTDDSDLTDRDAQLMSAVNQAVADWMAAQRRCANTISSLYGGQHYNPNNTDGNQTAGEYGYSAGQLNAAAGSDQGLPWGRAEDTGNPVSDVGHFVLDLGGLIPGVGEFADGANAAWYAGEGDYTSAGLSAAGMIPIVGWGATGGRILGKGAKAVTKGGDEGADAAEHVARGLAKGERARFGSSTTTDYRSTFFNAFPETEGRVVVHHAVEQQVRKHYPETVSQSELHSLENLRGIPKGEVNNRVHLSQLRKEWNRFYKANPNPTKDDLLDFATKMDDKYGHQFDPPVR